MPWFQRWADATVSVPYDRLRIATVPRGDLVRDVSVQGRVVAAVSPTLYATAAGSITLNVDAGEQVVTGQVLAPIASPALDNRLRQAEFTLEQREVELERQRIESRQQMLDKRKASDLAIRALIAAELEKRRADVWRCRVDPISQDGTTRESAACLLPGGAAGRGCCGITQPRQVSAR